MQSLRRPMRPGLRNPGVWCYANVIVQKLFYLVQFRQARLDHYMTCMPKERNYQR